MPFARSQGGLGIDYEIFGAGSLPLVLLHGWGGSASYWHEMVRQMELEGLQVIALSYRGHGDSDKPANGYTVDQFAKDVLAVAGTAGAKRFVLVGFSMSGKFAQYIAALHRERILGLVLIAPVPASEFPIPAEVGRAWCDAQQSRDDFKQILAPLVKIPIKAELTEAFLDDFQKAARVALEQTLEMCAIALVEPSERIQVPTLLLAGSYDPLVPPDLLRNTVLSRIAGARMIALPCGHEIPQEMPGQTAALLEAFVSGLGRSAMEAA